MPIATRTFRVFVSSTFEDLKEERDALQRDVFPKLRTVCEQHGARFQAIDLRWGVRDEAALDQQTMEICLHEIHRCRATGVRPNFIALLGDRYGWRPLPVRIPAAELDALKPHIPAGDAAAQAEQWYRLDENAVPPEYCLQPRTAEFVEPSAWNPVEQSLLQDLATAARATGLSEKELIKYEASATHQEILAGLGETEEDRQHVFGFVRRVTGNTDPRLEALKSHLRVHEFGTGDMKGLCELVLAQLTKVIEGEVKRFEDRPALNLEIQAHDRFAEDRCRIFIGRESALDTIADYIGGRERRPLILHGESGSGKSAVIAKASLQYQGLGRVIRRFIGASPESASGHALLTSLCRQIAPGETPVDYAQLENAFRERLSVATAEQPLVLFIDALDQLAASDPARDVTWLPPELPPHVKVIVSTTDDRERLPEGLPVRLERMTQSEGRQALDEMLRDSHRTLQPWHRNKVLAHFERCGLPLYLKLAAEESRLWKSYTPENVCALGEGVAGVIDTLFDRLSSDANHGPTLVERSLGYLATARYGLTEDEVLDVLTADDAVWSDFDQRKHHEVRERHLPAVVWSRLSLDLEPYLTERAAPGGTAITFYHHQLAERVAARFLAGAELQARHSALARYFSEIPPWLDEARKAPNARRAVEFVFHQRKSQDWSGGETTLLDCQFLLAKCAAGLVLDLDTDYQDLLTEAPAEALPHQELLSLVHSALLRSIHVVHHHPEQFASQMCGRLLGYKAESGIVAFLTELGVCANRPRLWPLWPSLEPAGGVAIRVLEGHTDSVEAVAISANCERVVSGSWDYTVRVWDLKGNRPPRVLEGHTFWVTAVGISANGARAVSGSYDHTVRVWDLNNGSRPPLILEGHTDHVNAVAICANGDRVVSGSTDGTVRVWDLKDSQPPRVLADHTDRVFSVAISANGERAVSGSLDNTVRVWDLKGSQPPDVLEGHTKTVTAVGISADGEHAVSGSLDKTVRVWDLKGGRPPRVLEGHTREVEAVAISANGEVVISGSRNFTVRVWDLNGSQFSRVLRGHMSDVNAVAISASGEIAVSGSSDETVRVWDLRRNQPLRAPEGHTDTVKAVAISANGQRAVSRSKDGTVRVWDLKSARSSHVLEGHPKEVTSVAISSNGEHAFSGSSDGKVCAWDLGGNRPPRVLKGHKGWGKVVAISANGELAVWHFDTFRVCGLSGKRLPRVLGDHAGTGGVYDVALSANGERAVSGGYDNTVHVWDLMGRQPPRILRGHTGAVLAAAISANGERVVSGSWDHTVRVWDLEADRSGLVLEGHRDYVSAVAISPNGEQAVSCSRDKTVRAWSLENGECLATFTCDTGFHSCAWGADRIVAGDEFGKVHLFQWEE